MDDQARQSISPSPSADPLAHLVPGKAFGHDAAHNLLPATLPMKSVLANSALLATTVPASVTGAAAALRYVRERYDIGQYPMYEEDGDRLLLFSTERAICAAAGLAVPRRGR